MGDEEKIASPLSINHLESPENGERFTAVYPTDEGVAIPRAQGGFTVESPTQRRCNITDTQKDKKKTSAENPSKKMDVRTFSDSYWYVALVKTKREKATCDIIDGFDSNHRVKVWLPMQAVRREQNGGVAVAYRLDIHNYLFFHLSRTDERNEVIRYETLRDIRSITHVYDLLIDPATRKPATIPNRQIVSFRKMLSDSRHPVRLIASLACKGTRVRVVSGELCGLEGTVEDLSKEDTEIYISLDCLGCAVIAIKTDRLEIINETPGENLRAQGPHPGKAGQSVRPKVSMAEWLSLHPYKEPSSIDRAYVDFANAVLNTLSDSSLGVPRANRKRLALSLATYVEDKRSRLGVFDCFVALRPHGMFHPVEAFLSSTDDKAKPAKSMTGYDGRKTNLLDVMYFLQANANGKQRGFEGIRSKAKTLLAGMERLGYGQLPSNGPYVNHLFYTLQDGMKGVKRSVVWLAHRLADYSYSTFPMPDSRHIFSRNPQVSEAALLGFVLPLAKRLRVKAAVTQLVKSMIHAPSVVYEVVGCYRKAVHLKAPDGATRIVYLDDISQGRYVVGERYLCRLVEPEEKKWAMVEPAVKQG